MARAETKIRRVLRSLAFWVILAYVFLLLMGVGGIVIALKTQQEETRRRATEAAAVEACIQGRPQVRAISKHVFGVNQLARADKEMGAALDAVTAVLKVNSEAAIGATLPSDPQLHVRRGNLARIKTARNRVIRARSDLATAARNVKAVSSFPVPTVQQCRARGGR